MKRQLVKQISSFLNNNRVLFLIGPEEMPNGIAIFTRDIFTLVDRKQCCIK